MQIRIIAIALLHIGLLGFLACSSGRQAHKRDEVALSIAKERKNCWTEGDAPTLLSVVQQAMQQPLEADYVRDNYIQTFGCAYEEVDIEQNATQAVYRAILQSLRNRGVTARDNLEALLRSRPPRPDNLVRDFTIYVTLPGEADGAVAGYEVKVLQLEMVHTVESPVAIWARVATRFLHRRDHFRALPVSEEKSAFTTVMRFSQEILGHAEQGKFARIVTSLNSLPAGEPPQPKRLDDLVFGDLIVMIDRLNPDRRYRAVYLGKGIVLGQTPQDGAVVFKLGEERLWGLRMDFRRLKRVTPIFTEYNYRAPEAILQCLFLKSRKAIRDRGVSLSTSRR